MKSYQANEVLIKYGLSCAIPDKRLMAVNSL